MDGFIPGSALRLAALHGVCCVFVHAQVDMLYVFDYFRPPQALTHTDSISCIHVGGSLALAHFSVLLKCVQTI